MDHPEFKRCRRFNDAGHAHALTSSSRRAGFAGRNGRIEPRIPHRRPAKPALRNFRRQPFLSKDRTRQWFVDAIAAGRHAQAFHVWAYVIMPEHVHLLIWPTTPEYSISRVLSAITLPVTRRALAFIRKAAPEFLSWMLDRQPNGRQSYRFWQRGGGYDRNLTEPATIWAEINYIHANPIRRKLCERPQDWKWSSAGVYAGLPGPLTIDFESLPRTKEG